VIVPLGMSEDLPVAVTSIQLLGEIPREVSLAEVSAILTEPNVLTRLSELKQLAQRIERLIQDKGYPYAYVLLPDQEIFNGRVRMLAVNGKIDRVVRVQGESRRLSDERVQQYFRDLIESAGFKRADFERTMLLLNDLPAISARLVLSPGSAQGLIDAKLDVDQGPFARWSVNINNHGAESTGRERTTVNLKLNDLSGLGDRLSMTFSKTSRNLSAGVLEYRRPIGVSGLTAQVTTLYSTFGVDSGLNSLGVKGTTQSTDLGLSYPLVLRFGGRLYAEGSSAYRRTGNDIEMLDAMRKALRVQRVGLRGSVSDTFLGGGMTSGRLSFTFGTIVPLAGYGDLSRRSFREQTFEIARSQSLSAQSSLLLSMSGQRTQDALDGSEQMAFGGAGAVRAYGAATLFADQGNLYKAELTHVLAADWVGLGVLRAFTFYDRGTAFNDPINGGRNTLSGAGMGVSLMRWGFYEVRSTYARRIGTSTFGNLPEDHRRSGQIWLNLLAFF
jgi:hemolysin activation/secretion protein